MRSGSVAIGIVSRVAERSRTRVKIDNAIEEQDAQKNHGKPTKFTHRKCLVAHARIHKEECPDNDDSGLIHDYTVRGRRKFGDIDGEAIEKRRCKQEAQAVQNDYRARPCLLTRKEDVIDMPIYALYVIKGTSQHLSWYQDHHRYENTEDTLPAHHVQRFLASGARQDMFFKDSMRCMEELTAK